MIHMQVQIRKAPPPKAQPVLDENKVFKKQVDGVAFETGEHSYQQMVWSEPGSLGLSLPFGKMEKIAIASQ